MTDLTARTQALHSYFEHCAVADELAAEELAHDYHRPMAGLWLSGRAFAFRTIAGRCRGLETAADRSTFQRWLEAGARGDSRDVLNDGGRTGYELALRQLVLLNPARRPVVAREGPVPAGR